MRSAKILAAAGALFVIAGAGAALAQQPPAAGAAAPRPQAVISKDPAQTVAGVYRMDPNHTSVIARLAHAGGYSLSTYRFGKSTGTLTWDPARVENSKIDVTVDAKSVMTPVPGDFVNEVMGERMLNTGKYPTMRFVSTGIRRTGPTTGQITGDFTFYGQTHPLTINAELVGGGKNQRGVAVIGFTGTAKFKRSEWGYTTGAPGIGDEVELILDAEFNQSPPPGAAPPGGAAPPR